MTLPLAGVDAGYPTAGSIPAPGVYENVPMGVYHSWQAASNSRLSRLRRSAAHLKAYLDEPPEDTAALIVGRAVHSAILEPDDFSRRYVGAPDIDRRTKEGKATWERLLNEHGDGYVLKRDEYHACLRVRDAVHAHPAASALLAGDGHVEFSVTWRDDEADVTCKARLDRHAWGVAGGTIVDIKSTRDASPREFERSIFTLGYHRQAAFYLDALRVSGTPAEHFVIIAVEKEPPYAVAVYRLTDGAIDAGREQLRPLLHRYATCIRTNVWPAYPDEVQDIALPTWAWSQIDDEVRTFGTNYNTSE